MTQYSEFLSDHARGQVDGEATAVLVDLISAVTATGKKGTMSVTVEVKPSGTRMVQVKAEVTSKIPQADAEIGVFFIDKDGRLQKDDPFQERLPIEEFQVPRSTTVTIPTDFTPPTVTLIDGTTGELTQVDSSTGEITNQGTPPTAPTTTEETP